MSTIFSIEQKINAELFKKNNMEFLRYSKRMLSDIILEGKSNCHKIINYDYQSYTNDCREIYQWIDQKTFPLNHTLNLVKNLAQNNCLHLLVMERWHESVTKYQRPLSWDSYERTGGGYIRSCMFTLKLVLVLINYIKTRKDSRQIIRDQLHKIISLTRQALSFYSMEKEMKQDCTSSYFFTDNNVVVMDSADYIGKPYQGISGKSPRSEGIGRAKNMMEYNLEALKTSKSIKIKKYSVDDGFPSFLFQGSTGKVLCEAFGSIGLGGINEILHITANIDENAVFSYIIIAIQPKGEWKKTTYCMLRLSSVEQREDSLSPRFMGSSANSPRFTFLKYVCQSLYDSYLKNKTDQNALFRYIGCLDTLHLFVDGNGRVHDFLLHLFLAGSLDMKYSSVFTPWFYSYNFVDDRIHQALYEEGIDYITNICRKSREYNYFGLGKFLLNYKAIKNRGSRSVLSMGGSSSSLLSSSSSLLSSSLKPRRDKDPLIPPKSVKVSVLKQKNEPQFLDIKKSITRCIKVYYSKSRWKSFRNHRARAEYVHNLIQKARSQSQIMKILKDQISYYSGKQNTSSVPGRDVGRYERPIGAMFNQRNTPKKSTWYNTLIECIGMCNSG
ncbi:MAG: hypothetical protein GY710_00410 [Desulfobacteraceae bacterium]|nr:hypothetical protein [Desulfobacteraceae bacterium]